MNEYTDSLLKLPGAAEEKDWLKARLEMQSVREGVVLAAAVERSPPGTMMEAVNCLLTLDRYDICPASSYETLGEFCLREQHIPQKQIPFFDRSALGQWYEDEHPGLFVGNYYVAYPDREVPPPYDGQHLPSDVELLDWSVRLKLASEQVPEGVWVKLPDRECIIGKPDEFRLARDALNVRTLHECTLLEARCILPCIRSLASQYDSLADLIYGGDSLGLFFDEHREKRPEVLDRFLTTLQYEGCHRLDDAVNISEGLGSYDIVGVDAFMDKLTQDLSGQPWAQAGDGTKGCFDYAAYAASLAEQQGYSISDDGNFYIRRRGSPEVELERSAAEVGWEAPGMTM